MINENNLLGWIYLMRDVLDDKDCNRKIDRFIVRHRNGNRQSTSKYIWDRYVK